MNETLNGAPIHLEEESGVIRARGKLSHVRQHTRFDGLPEDGILAFDYVVLRPRAGLPVSASDRRLDLTQQKDRALWSRLRAVSYSYKGDPWLLAVLGSGQAADAETPSSGGLGEVLFDETAVTHVEQQAMPTSPPHPT